MTTIEAGLCQCGCGERAPLATSSNPKRGHVKGRPHRFIAGHFARTLRGRPACSIDGCDDPSKGHGLCSSHYARTLRTGDAGATPILRGEQRYQRTSPAERLTQKLAKGEGGGCWEWSGRLNPSGYGLVIIHPAQGAKETWLTHRLAYTLARGPIPAELEVDHLCRNRRCANPAHMELVTHRENTLRGTAPSAVNARKTHCLRGHEFTLENTYVWVGPRGTQRHCRECSRARRARAS